MVSQELPLNVKNLRVGKKINKVTESGELLLEVWIITVGVLEIPINQELLHDKLVRKGLAKCQNSSFPRVGLL